MDCCVAVPAGDKVCFVEVNVFGVDFGVTVWTFQGSFPSVLSSFEQLALAHSRSFIAVSSFLRPFFLALLTFGGSHPSCRAIL